MDRLYKTPFLLLVKEGMARDFPGFAPIKVARGQPDAEVFAGALVYCLVARPGHAVWIWWQPGPGVERRFMVFVGWSPSPGVLPVHAEHDRRMYSLQGPTPAFPACSLSLEQVLGRSAMAGFGIPSPWDRLYQLKPATPGAEQKRVMQQAASEAAAMTPEARTAAVRGIVGEVFADLHSVIPSFMTPPARPAT